jgi:hypothetical protein
MAKFTDENDKEYDEVFFDGYSFTERLLEGVTFKAVWSEEKKEYIVGGPWDTLEGKYIVWETDPYLCLLNKNLLMAQAQDRIESEDNVGGPYGEDLYRDE